MICKMKKSWLLLIGLVFITCNTSEVKKTAPLEVVKAKDTTQVVKADVVKKETLVFKVQIAALKMPNKRFSKLEGTAVNSRKWTYKIQIGEF